MFAKNVFLVILVLIVGVTGIDPNVGRALVSLNRIMKFLKENLDHGEAVVPDILFGIVLALGQVRVLLRHLEQDRCTVNLTAPEKSELRGELSNLQIIMRKSIRSNRAKVPKKNNTNFNLLVDKMLDSEFWEIDQPLVGHSLPQPPDYSNVTLDEERMEYLMFNGLPNEELSDLCMGQILGVRHARCFVGPKCRKVQLEAGRSTGYPLTHRLLFVQAARQAGCDTLGSPSMIAAYTKYFCSLILGEAQLIEYLGFPKPMTDLFAEQVALCGMEGFLEFTKANWLEQILSWQRPVGCFGNEEEKEETKYETQHSRRKREEGVMVYNCLMHFTGVAMAAIATSIRPLVECVNDVTEEQK